MPSIGSKATQANKENILPPSTKSSLEVISGCGLLWPGVREEAKSVGRQQILFRRKSASVGCMGQRRSVLEVIVKTVCSASQH
jgi:hypothetical protein